MENGNLKNYADDLLAITEKERGNYAEYADVCRRLRQVMAKYGLLEYEVSGKKSRYSEIDEEKVKGWRAYFLADKTHTPYAKQHEYEAYTAKSYLFYLLASITPYFEEKTEKEWMAFAHIYIKLVDYVYPLPYITKMRSLQNDDLQIGAFSSEDGDLGKELTLANFRNLKKGLIKTLLATSCKEGFPNSLVQLYRENKDLHRLDTYDLLAAFAHHEAKKVIEEHGEEEALSDWKKASEDYSRLREKEEAYRAKQKGKGLDYEAILGPSLYEEELKLLEKRVYHYGQMGHLKAVLDELELKNLLYLRECFFQNGDSFEEYREYIQTIFAFLEEAYEEWKASSEATLAHKVEENLGRIKRILYRESVCPLEFGEASEIINYKMGEDSYSYSEKMKYWLSVLEVETKYNTYISFEGIEEAIEKKLSEYGRHMSKEKQIELASKFFNRALTVNKNINVANVDNYKPLTISIEKCIENIIGNSKIIELIAASETVLTTLGGTADLVGLPDYSSFIVTGVKALERYLKEVIVQAFPYCIIDTRYGNKEYRITDNTPLSSDLLSGKSSVFLLSSSKNDGETPDPTYLKMELGPTCYCLKNISLDERLSRRFAKDASLLFGNRGENLPINTEFGLKVRNGYFHIDTIDDYDTALDLHSKTAYWLMASIETFENVKLKDNPVYNEEYRNGLELSMVNNPR